MKPRAAFKLALALVAGTAAAAPAPLQPGWAVEPGAPISVPRAAHQASLLDAGLVLLTGGCSGLSCSPVERSAELVDTGNGQPVAAAPMAVPRVAHAAVRLGDGRVLVVGGWTGSATTATAELFDPRSRRFSRLADMAAPRMDMTATRLPGGGVLVAGGAAATNRPLAAAEVFEQGRFAPVAPMNEARAHHAAVPLADGRVLLMGGQVARGRATASAEIFDPRSRSFTATGPMGQARCKHAAVGLQDGRAMVIGGSADCNAQHRIAQTEFFDPATGRFTPGPALRQARYKIASAAVVTEQGEVIVAGEASEVERWSPGAPAFSRLSGTLGRNLAFSTATALPGGAVLITGGYDDDIRPTAQTWLASAPVRPPGGRN
jgi:hypothetical protein